MAIVRATVNESASETTIAMLHARKRSPNDRNVTRGQPSHNAREKAC